MAVERPISGVGALPQLLKELPLVFVPQAMTEMGWEADRPVLVMMSRKETSPDRCIRARAEVVEGGP